jgi:hypothetical protein
MEGDGIGFPLLETEAEIAAVPPAILLAIFANVEHHFGLWLQAEGNLFQCLL